jgi:hypothetical protein
MGALIPRKRESRTTILAILAEVSVARPMRLPHISERCGSKRCGRKPAHPLIQCERPKEANRTSRAKGALAWAAGPPNGQFRPIPGGMRSSVCRRYPRIPPSSPQACSSLVTPQFGRVAVWSSTAARQSIPCIRARGQMAREKLQLLPSSDSQSLIPATMNAHPVTCHPIVISLSSRAVRSPTNLKVRDQRKRTLLLRRRRFCPDGQSPGRLVPSESRSTPGSYSPRSGCAPSARSSLSVASTSPNPSPYPSGATAATQSGPPCERSIRSPPAR